MASLFNSKHNKYVSIPDWFKDTDFGTEQTAEHKTTYIVSGGGAVNTAPGLSNVILYNKFVIENTELDKEVLTIIDTALCTKESEEFKIGDNVSVSGWGTTEYISVAGNTTMNVTSQIVETLSTLYGILFYDNTKSVIGSHLLTSSPEQVAVPENAYYFRISTPLSYEEFKIEYSVAVPYNDEQLTQANGNITDYLSVNEAIPDGNNAVQFSSDSLKLLVQSPLSITKDINNVIKLSIGNTSSDSINDMFVWDKKLTALGYDAKTGTAYSYINGEQQFTTDEQGNQIPVTTENPDFWIYDETLSDKWIIKSTRPRLSWLDNMLEYNAEKNCFMLHGNLATTGGITSYADDDSLDVKSIYDGLPIDWDTIYWGLDENGNKTVLKAKGGNVDGIGTVKESLSWEGFSSGSWNGSVKALIRIPKDTNQLTNGAKYITASALDGYAKSSDLLEYLPLSGKLPSTMNSEFKLHGNLRLQKESEQYGRKIIFGSGNSTYIQEKDDNCIYINSNAGLKLHTTSNYYVDIEGKGITLNTGKIIYDVDNKYFKLDGDLLVTGGITQYADNGTGNQWILNVEKLEDVTSKEVSKVYSANVTSMMQQQIVDLSDKLNDTVASLESIAANLKNIDENSTIANIRTALMNIYNALTPQS